MEKLVDIFCRRYNLTRYKLAKITGISEQTWRAVNDRDLSKYTVKQIKAMGTAADISPDQVLKELLALQEAGVQNEIS